jgi:hypothetical protein
MNDDQTPNKSNGGDASEEPKASYRIYTDADHANAKAAMNRIRKILDHDPHLTDDKGYVISTNELVDDAQQFIRNNLDLNGSSNPADEGLTTLAERGDIATGIYNDLATIWDYEYFRGDLSNIAIELSLCPLHFCDWAACFDDDDAECSQIRAIFPHNHDT